jgi:uncharacterized protein (TIGR02300 family)
MEFPVANPEWGIKRVCQNCSTKFYDLQREPIICPKCQTEFDPEAFLKTRRARPVVADKEQAAVPAKAAATDVEDLDLEDAEVLEEDDVVGATGDADDEEDEDLIEDASELGEDEDDMAEVIENVDEEEER